MTFETDDNYSIRFDSKWKITILHSTTTHLLIFDFVTMQLVKGTGLIYSQDLRVIGCKARGQKRRIGWFPANYVRLLTASASASPEPSVSMTSQRPQSAVSRSVITQAYFRQYIPHTSIINFVVKSR